VILPLLAVLFGCDLDSALRAAAKSSLPPRTLKNVTAKVRYAETMHKVGTIAPTTPQEELKIARAMAKDDATLVRAIDSATHCFDEGHDLPARLTIRVLESSSAPGFEIDGVGVRADRETITVQLAAGRHEITVYTNDDLMSSTTVTLAPGEPRTIEMRGEKKRLDLYGDMLDPHLDSLVNDEALKTLCLTAYHGKVLEPVAMKSLDRVTVDKRGTYDVTDLFEISEDGNVCVADSAPLRDIVHEGGPFSIRIVGRAASGPRIDATGLISFGHEVTIRGTASDGVAFVKSGMVPEVPVKDGHFEIKVPEGRVDLLAMLDAKHADFFHHLEVHCDAEVQFTREKAEIVHGGCPEAGGAAWREPLAPDHEDLQQLLFDFKDGKLTPSVRFLRREATLESDTEENLLGVTGPGGLQVRAYSDDGTLVFRTTAAMRIYNAGDVVADTILKLNLPLTARYVDIKGWTPETTGRFDVKDFAKSL